MLRHIATMPKKESEEEESTAKRPRQDSTIEFLLGDSLVKDRSPQDEVENFLRKPAVGPNADLLKWWKANEHCFLILSKLAKRLLCIPTSVPAERLFSISGLIVNRPENIYVLAFLNRNLHLKHTVNCDLFALMKQCFEVMKNARNAQG